MADVIYNSLKADVGAARINLAADTIKCLLVTSAYVPNKDTHAKRSDITGEVVGAGYTAGGVALQNQTFTQDNIADESVLDADDVSWPIASVTARGAVLYKSRGGAPNDDELLMYIDFGSDVTSSGAEFLIEFDPTGILAIG